MTQELITLSVLMLLLACFAAYLVVRLPVKYKLKFLLVPAVVGLGVLLVIELPKIMGSPLQKYPEETFEYLAHAVMSNEEGELSIQLWAETEGEGSKLYEFAFSQETLDKLAELQSLQQQGLPAKGKFNQGMNANGIEDGQEWVELDVEEPDFESILPSKN